MFTSDMFDGEDSFRADDPKAGFWASLWGAVRTKSKAGVQVTPDLALSLTTFQACVTTIAESVAQLPIALYRRDGEDRKAVVDHPAAQVLLAPNGWQTAYEYQEQQALAVPWRGNAYAFIERDQAARPIALIPLNPDRTTVLRGSDGMPYYRLGLEAGAKTVPKDAIHHVRWHTKNGYTGIDPVTLHCDTLGLALAMRDHAGMVFSNGTHLAGVLERPAAVGGEIIEPLGADAVAAIKGEWKAEYAGAANALKVAVLQDGMTFKPLSMTNVEAQLIEARGASALEIAQAYHMPPHKVGLLDRATNNNIAHQSIEYVIYCLMAWLKRFEGAYSRDLLLPSERGTYYFEFNVSGLLRGDTGARYAAYALGRQWGWLSVNDIRRLENLPPIKGGDEYLRPLNMVPVGQQTPPSGSQPTDEALAEVHKILTM